MALLAEALYGHPSGELDVVGVTGTNGKTTTALLVAAILDAAQRPCGLIGTVERRVGGRREPAGPDDAGGARPAAHAPLDARGRRRGLRDGGLVDRDRAAAARGHAIRGRRLHESLAGPPRLPRRPGALLRGQGLALRRSLPARGQRGRPVRAAPGGRAALRRRCEDADVRCEDFTLRPDRTELFVRTPQGGLSLEPRLRGRFNVDNVLCAVTLALLLDVPLGAIEIAVAATGAPPGRFEPVDAGQPFGVIVDYAHTPAGIAAVLASARPLASGRLLCVFGAGGDRDQAKRPLMGAAAEAGADRLYVTSDNSRSEPTEHIIERDPGRARAPRRRRRARPAPRDRACAGGCGAGRPRADPRQGARAGPGHRRRGRALRRSHGGGGAARGRRVIALAAGELQARACSAAIRPPGSRASSATRARRGPARSSARCEGERSDGHDFLDDVRAAGAVAVLCRTGRSRPLDGVCVLEADEPLDGARRHRAPGATCLGREGDRYRRIEWQDVHQGHARRALRPARADTRHSSQPQQPPRPAADALPAGAAARAVHLRARHERDRRAGRSGRHRRARHRRDHEHRARAPGVPGRSRGRRARGGLAAGRPAGRAAMPCCPRASRCSLPTGAATCARRPSASRAATCAASPGSPGPAVRAQCWTCSASAASCVVPLRAPTTPRIWPRLPRRTSARACRSPASPPARPRSSSRRCAGRSRQRHGGGVLVNDAYNANPASVESALAALVERAAGARTVAVLGHMAELGPEAPRWHAEVGRACARLGVDVVIGVGELAAGVRDGGRGLRVALGARRRRGGGAAAARPSPGRRRAAQGLALGRHRAAGGGRAVTHVLGAGVLATFLTVLTGGAFISFLRDRSLGQNIREEGPIGHRVKQGTPTMGGLLILTMATIAFLIFTERSAQAFTVLGVTAGLRRDRLRRRLRQDRQQALARAGRPLEARTARAHLGRARIRRAPRGALDAPLPATDRHPHRPRLGLVHPRLPGARRARRAPSTSPTAWTGSRPARARSRSWPTRRSRRSAGSSRARPARRRRELPLRRAAGRLGAPRSGRLRRRAARLLHRIPLVQQLPGAGVHGRYGRARAGRRAGRAGRAHEDRAPAADHRRACSSSRRSR